MMERYYRMLAGVLWCGTLRRRIDASRHQLLGATVLNITLAGVI